MIQVAAYSTRSDAELAQTALAAAGIESAVTADDAGLTRDAADDTPDVK